MIPSWCVSPGPDWQGRSRDRRLLEARRLISTFSGRTWRRGDARPCCRPRRSHRRRSSRRDMARPGEPAPAEWPHSRAIWSGSTWLRRGTHRVRVALASCCSARLRSEISRAIFDAPTTTPSALRIGETLSEMGTSRPSRACRTVSKCSTRRPARIARQHCVFLGLPIIGNDAANGRANHLVGGIPEHAFGRLVPRQNDSVQVLADDGIVGRLDDGGETASD